MAKSYEVDTETKTKLGISQKISLTFMLTVAIMVVGLALFAAFYTYGLNLLRGTEKVNTNINTNVSNVNTDNTFQTE